MSETRRRFVRAATGLSRGQFERFVAAVWRERGPSVERRGRSLEVAPAVASGEGRTFRVAAGWRALSTLAMAPGREPAIDTIVVRRPLVASLLRRLLDTARKGVDDRGAGIEVLSSADLYELFAYAIDGEARRRLADEFFDEPVEALMASGGIVAGAETELERDPGPGPGPDGTLGRLGTELTAGALVLLVVAAVIAMGSLAGGLVGPPSVGTGTGTATVDTVTPIPATVPEYRETGGETAAAFGTSERVTIPATSVAVAERPVSGDRFSDATARIDPFDPERALGHPTACPPPPAGREPVRPAPSLRDVADGLRPANWTERRVSVGRSPVSSSRENALHWVSDESESRHRTVYTAPNGTMLVVQIGKRGSRAAAVARLDRLESDWQVGFVWGQFSVAVNGYSERGALLDDASTLGIVRRTVANFSSPDGVRLGSGCVDHLLGPPVSSNATTPAR